jgi:RNA-directed DNA polymerase
MPNAEGRPRPLGTPTLEDHIVQRATGEGRNAISEQELLGCSYGARPGRRPPHAVDAVTVGSEKRHSHGGRDADSRGFYEASAPAWLGQCVEHRRGAQRAFRPQPTGRKARWLEDGHGRPQEAGTPQGGRAGPVRAPLSLHDVLDLGAAQGRRRPARGDVLSVRSWDDGMGGVQPKDAAEQGVSARRERCHRGHLALPPAKTRLREVGRWASDRRQRRGPGQPATGDFLGFPHMGGTTQRGKVTVRLGPIAQRLRKKLQEVKQPRRMRRHWPIEKLGAWRQSGVGGHSRYSGVPRNMGRLWGVRERIRRSWGRPRRRRSQRHRMTWQRLDRRATPWLPAPPMLPPYPAQRLRGTTQGRSPVRSCRTPGSVRGGLGNSNG